MINRGAYRFNEQDLARLLKLKPGQRVIGVHADFVSMSVLVMVEGPGLPEYEPGTYVETVGDLRDIWDDA